MTFIYAIPAWLFLAAAIVLFTAAACGGHVLVRRAFAREDFRTHNDVAGFVYAVVGVMYAVLIGFVVVIIWQQYNDSEERAREEVAAAAFAYKTAAGLPQPASHAIRTSLRGYIDAVALQEWPAMRTGGTSAAAQRALDAAIAGAIRSDAGPAAAAVQTTVLATLRDVAQARRHRLEDNETGLQGLLWAALWIGAIVVVGFSYLFGLANMRVQLLMTAAMAILIATLFVVIAEFDYPFRGDVSISSDPWNALRATLPPP